jgi:cell division protein FtsI (penicillin-binding protein 3)
MSASPNPGERGPAPVDAGARRRAGAVAVLAAALFLFLLGRLFSIQVVGHETYRGKRDAQARGIVIVETPAGTLRDARGQILAVSVPVESVWADPSALGDRPAAARLLAQALGMRPEAVLERLSSEERRFAWIKRKVAPEEADRVRKLLKEPPFAPKDRGAAPALGLATEFARRYPQGPVLSHVLGFRSEDEESHEGLERALARVLEGGRRAASVDVDGLRRPLGGPSLEAPPEAVLTIDLLLQRIVEEELDAACAEHRPDWASVVAMDPRTGAILALANRPGFDPNDPAASPGAARRNRAVVDPYEPGSTLKPFLAAYALDLGLVTPQTTFDCENGLWKHGPRLLHDHHPYGRLTLAEVIKYSSNIGAAKLGALTLGRARLHECMARWGFGSRTGVDLPAEDPGRLFPLSRWSVYSDTSVPMGHEIAVTPLQLATAMSAVASGGTLHRPFVIRRVVGADGTVLHEGHPVAARRLIGSRAAAQMVEILADTVRDGTGKKAQVPGVTVAGKTGTTQKVDPLTKRYTRERYISSFVGFAPAEEPRVCIAVVIDEPKGGAYYGGAVAAPVVGRILQRGLVHVP